MSVRQIESKICLFVLERSDDSSPVSVVQRYPPLTVRLLSYDVTVGDAKTTRLVESSIPMQHCAHRKYLIT